MAVATKVFLTRRALRDLNDIENYSVENWGKRVSREYIDSIQGALDLLKNNPDLLRIRPNVTDSFLMYRVREHYLICAAEKKSIFVLGIIHGSMDLPNRIAELEPSLKADALALYRNHFGKKPARRGN